MTPALAEAGKDATLATVRSILSLAMFVASLGVFTSGLLAGPGDPPITATGSDDEPGFTVDEKGPARWSLPSDRKRLSPVVADGQLVHLNPGSVSAPPVSRGTVLKVAPIVRPNGDATRLASPRAPPAFPS